MSNFVENTYLLFKQELQEQDIIKTDNNVCLRNTVLYIILQYSVHCSV